MPPYYATGAICARYDALLRYDIVDAFTSMMMLLIIVTLILLHADIIPSSRREHTLMARCCRHADRR